MYIAFARLLPPSALLLSCFFFRWEADWLLAGKGRAAAISDAKPSISLHLAPFSLTAAGAYGVSARDEKFQLHGANILFFSTFIIKEQ